MVVPMSSAHEAQLAHLRLLDAPVTFVAVVAWEDILRQVSCMCLAARVLMVVVHGVLEGVLPPI